MIINAKVIGKVPYTAKKSGKTYVIVHASYTPSDESAEGVATLSALCTPDIADRVELDDVIPFSSSFYNGSMRWEVVPIPF